MSARPTISKRYLIAVAFLGIVLTVLLQPWRAASPENPNDRDSRHVPIMANDSPAVSPGFVEPTRTKSSIRTHHPKPTIEETTALLRTTIIPRIDLPADQPLAERIARINELIQKAGVEPHRLRLILRSADPASQWRSRHELKLRDVPLGIALKYLIDSTKLRSHIRENGIIELTSWREEPLPDLPDPPKKAPRPTSGETDIFGNDINAPEEMDPFAEPVE